MRVVEGYRPGPGMPTKQRTIRDFGYLEDQEDPEAFIGKVKESYGLGRLVVVADKGLNSSKNIDMIVNNGDGFVFSQILKGKKRAALQ